MQFDTYLKITFRYSVIILALSLMLPGAIGLAWSKNNTLKNHAVILMYHRFGQPSAPSTNITMDQFRTQLDFIVANGFTVRPLSRVLQLLEQQKPVPDKTVVITIDDAHISVFQHAWPELKRRGMPFTVFVAGKRVDEGAQNLMSWSQMRELKASGVEFGNHSWSHDHMIKARAGENAQQWQKRIEHEIDFNQQRIEEELGNTQKIFAYPYGEYGRVLQSVLDSKGYTGFGQHSGVISKWSDKLAVPRYPINERYSAIPDFSVKLYTLPFPLLPLSYGEPILKVGRAIRVMLKTRDFSLENVNCYASEAREMDVQRANKFTLRVKLHTGFVQRRGRVNCTLLDPASGRYYWHSQMWIQPWVAEASHW